MAHDEVSFNKLTFIENLQRVPITNSGPFATGSHNWAFIIDTMNRNASPTLNKNDGIPYVNAFFASFNPTTNPLPKTFDAFVAAFRSFISGTGIPGMAASEEFGLLVDYVMWTRSDTRGLINGPGMTTISSDWEVLNPPPDLDTLNEQMQAWFDHFLSTYPPGPVPPTAQQFFAKASEQLTTIAFLRNSTSFDDIPTYEGIYQAFFPNGDFAARVNEFYQEQIAKNGYFIPSQSFDDWIHTITHEYAHSISSQILEPGSLASMNAKKTVIIDRIFRLLKDLLETMQGIAAAQANRLLILSQWQRAYTDVLGQLPVFLQADGKGLADNSTVTITGDKASVRNTLNNTVNPNLRENLQTHRNLVSDEAKALQSNINQSNDVVSQQANMATALIQELSTILGAIFR